MNTDIDGESENQENLDNDAEQTTIKDEINDEYKEYKTSRELFEECLQKSFYETGKQELISIISNKFPKLGRKISSHYEIDTLINIFIDYCASHGEFTVAWSVIKEKRSYWYNDFFPRWSHAVRQEEHIEYGYKNKQRNQQNQDDLVEWFFKLNDPVAQSMVITAALFQGVERNTFNEMALDIYKLLFPPGQEVPKSEPPSGENQENSVQEEKEQQAPPQSPLLKNELEQFQLARLKFILDKRNSHYGLTDVEIVIFEFNNYQTEILKLIKNNLYSKQSDLFEFIRSLVDDRSAEKRLFAVKALIALSETHLFQDLLNSIIRNWAKTENLYTHQATALTLSGILLQERLENEILVLLNSWLKTGSSTFLNMTSMFTYYLIADKYPDQALIAVAYISDKEKISSKSSDIVFKVYRSCRSKFIAYLSDWLKDERPLIRQMAGSYFFRFINIEDAATDQDSIEKVVEIIAILWKDRKMPNCVTMQKDTVEKVRGWAEEALVALAHDEREAFSQYQEFFYKLYQECSKKLDYYFDKWQKNREYKQQRAIKRGASNESLFAARQVSFFLLIPTKE